MNLSRRYPSNAKPITFLEPDDPVLADLRFQNLMRAACEGDPRAQYDLGVEAMIAMLTPRRTA